MNLPKIADKPSPRGFGIANILGLVFLITGILLIIVLTGFDLPIDLGNFETILEYGAAIGSILGGMAMLFKKHETEIKMK